MRRLTKRLGPLLYGLHLHLAIALRVVREIVLHVLFGYLRVNIICLTACLDLFLQLLGILSSKF